VTSKKTFVGFGFGPIQSGLFCFEARMSGNFSRFVIAEIDYELVRAVRENGGRYTVNVARKDRIDRVSVEGVELYNPTSREGREVMLEAVADADEIATALPSVDFYDTDAAGAARLIAEGLSGRTEAKPTVIYAAENHNHAAEILTAKLAAHAAPAALEKVQVVNTVIGKMSGVIADPDVVKRLRLETITPHTPRAVLVEKFNRILTGRVSLPGFRRGIDVFVEKDDLLPFEEAKLYGHNAIHALMGYLADLAHLETMAQAGDDERIMRIARTAFVDESGAALCRRHAGLGDELFTPAGYRRYAEDLLERMIRPTLNDLVERVCRDHVRKLGYDDRLFGTMRIALEEGIEPVNLALGAAAGVLSMTARREELASPSENLPELPEALSRETLTRLLREIWGQETDRHADRLIELTRRGLETLMAR